jgi:hypothetical protein
LIGINKNKEIKLNDSVTNISDLDIENCKISDSPQESPTKRTETIFSKMDLDNNG